MISRFFDWFLFFILYVFGVSTLHNKYCQLQCFGNVTNTVCDRADQKCGPNPECGEDFRVIELDDDDRQYILDIHNYLRNKVALGHEKRGRQPPAANMMAMFAILKRRYTRCPNETGSSETPEDKDTGEGEQSYDRELEFMAQCWANACKGNPLVHDICRRTCKYEHIGQNLGSISSTNPKIDLVKSLKELILGWYDEVADYNSTWINDTKPRDKETGHYTQLVWANTNTVGCAVSYYSTLSQDQKWYVLLLVCDYGPGGNYLGSPVYQVGQPCTCFPSTGAKNKVYQGLCGVDRRLKDTDQYKKDVF